MALLRSVSLATENDVGMGCSSRQLNQQRMLMSNAVQRGWSTIARAVDVAQDHVGFAGHAAEVAEAHDLPFPVDCAQKCGAGDVVVGDVVDLEAAGGGAAQQHVAGVGAVEAAEADELPIGSDRAQL